MEDWPNPSAAGARRSTLMEDLLIEGDLTSAGPVEIHGKIVGKLRAPEVFVAPSGLIEGEIAAFDLQAHGTISGSVVARQVSLTATSVLRADITQVRIAVESGAQVEGRLIRKS